MVNQNDMEELRRMACNLYGDDKACINRVLRGIAQLNAEVLKLKGENANK